MDSEAGQIFTAVKSRVWVATLTFSAMCFLFLVWAFVGAIPSEAKGTGIVLGPKGNFSVVSAQEGVIEQITVKPGDMIKKGQVLGKLQNLTIETKKKQSEELEQLVEHQRALFLMEHKQRLQAEIIELDNSIYAQQEIIERVSKEISYLDQDLKWKQDLYKEGLIALEVVHKTIRLRNEKEKEKDAALVSILESEAKKKKLSELSKKQEYETRINSAEDKRQLAVIKDDELDIVSPFSGRVIAVPVSLGERISKGSALVRASREIENEKDLVVYGYFETKNNQEIAKGMLANINLNEVDQGRYGEILAKVKEISPFPVSKEDMKKSIGNSDIVSMITKGKPVAPVEVVLVPIKDPKTVTGFKWTSEKGFDKKIHAGSIAEISIIVERKRPIEYAFPVFRTIKEYFWKHNKSEEK